MNCRKAMGLVEEHAPVDEAAGQQVGYVRSKSWHQNLLLTSDFAYNDTPRLESSRAKAWRFKQI